MKRVEEGELGQLRITNWLKLDDECGPSCYDGCQTNVGWLTHEMMRWKSRGIATCIIRRGEYGAMYRLRVGDTIEALTEQVLAWIAEHGWDAEEEDNGRD